MPLLADPAYARLIQTIGLASLAADDKQIWHLTKVYWHTVEFGVVREGDQVKAFGAGRDLLDVSCTRGRVRCVAVCSVWCSAAVRACTVYARSFPHS